MPDSGKKHSHRLTVDQLRRAVDDSYRRLQSRRIRAILLSALSAVLGLLLVFLIAENYQYFSPPVKIGFFAVCLLSGGLLIYFLRRRFGAPDFQAFYSDLSRVTGNHSLRYLLDFDRYRRTDPTLLQEAAIIQNLKQIPAERLSDQLHSYGNNHPYKKIHHYSLGMFAVLALLTVMAGWLNSDALKRTAYFWEKFEKPLPFTYSIEPGNAILAQGDLFRARVIFNEGSLPENVTIGIKTDVESEFRMRRMNPDGGDAFASDDLELYNNVSYFIRMDGHDSEVYTAEVQLLPRLAAFNITVVPPAYTGLSEESLTYPFNRVEAYQGSELHIEARPNKSLIRSELVSGITGDTLRLSPDNEYRYRETLPVTQEDSLHFLLEDDYGLSNTNPFAFSVRALEDQKPFAAIISPERETSVRNPENLDLAYEIEDDFGFTAVELHYKLNKAYVEQPQTGRIRLSIPDENYSIARFTWDLSEFGLSSLDVMEYWIEVTDNDEYSGFKTTRSESHFLNVQSLADHFFDQEERESDIETSFEQVQDIYRQMQDRYQQFREQLQTDPDNSWEQSQTLDDISSHREDLDRQVDELKKKFDELTRDMEDSRTLSDETLQQYEELRNLIEEIDDPEILELLEELRNNLDNFDQSRLREALEEIEFNESSYRERLERTVELFKTLRMNSELEKMSELLKELSEQEGRLMEQVEAGEEQIRQQESIREQLEELSKRLDELPEKSPQRRMQRMEQLKENMMPEMDQVDGMLQENIDQMQQESPDGDHVRQQQEQIRENLENMSRQMSDARQQMQQQSIQVNIAALKNILQNMILLSEAQEDLTVRTSELEQNSQGFVEQARRQLNISRNFETIVDSLYQVSSEIPQFSNRINRRKQEIQQNMQRALDYHVERNRRHATTEERTVLGGLNELGSMLADLIDQLEDQMDGNGGGGMSAEQMLEQMRDLSGDQQELNRQIQDMINDLHGERLTQDQMERLNQMARQQNEIRRQLRELQRSGGLDSGDRVLSEMERLSEEMENTINELRGGVVDEMMIERQQNILSRMLEAEKAMEQRDQDEERRRGDMAEDYDEVRPPEMTLEEMQRQIRSGIQGADQTRFSEDYQRLIEKYFQLLDNLLERQSSGR